MSSRAVEMYNRLGKVVGEAYTLMVQLSNEAREQRARMEKVADELEAWDKKNAADPAHSIGWAVRKLREVGDKP